MVKQKKFQVPETYVLIFFLIIFSCILTHLIPAGVYDLIPGTKMINPDTFHFVENEPAGIFNFLDSFYKGLQKGSSTIFVVFLIGGAFQVVTDSGAINAGLNLVMKKASGKYYILVTVVMLTMSILGTLGVGNNVALAFAPIAVMLARKLRLDGIVVMCMMYFASNVGFSVSPVNPFTVVLGQEIAGIPIMSGLGMRMILWIICQIVAIVYVLRYCKKILDDPSKSSVGVYSPDEDDGKVAFAEAKLSARDIMNLTLVILTFAVYSYGSIKFNWGMGKLGSAMVALAILSAIVSGRHLNDIAKSYVNGCKTMTYSAMLIGFASAINVIMSDAKIIHSIIYYLTLPLMQVPTYLSAVGMQVVNTLFSCIVASGSGQCYIVMPLMAPAADVLGISRQIAVTAFQLGDGFTNALIPTSGLLMGTMGMIPGLNFEKWFVWCIKVSAIFIVIGAIFLMIASMIGWS